MFQKKTKQIFNNQHQQHIVGQVMSETNFDYEEGDIVQQIVTNKNWWEFWKPGTVPMSVGKYTRTGNVVDLDIRLGNLYLTGKSKNGEFVGYLSGLPNVAGEEL
jgi:hypothetical protein